MKVVLRTNEDDWREIEWSIGQATNAYRGHSIPESIWLRILRDSGVAVEIILDDFGVNDESEDSVDSWESEGGQQ